MKPSVLIVDSVAEGTALGAEPEAYLVLVFKDGVKLAQFFVANPDYVAPPAPTPLEEAEEAWREARAQRTEAIDAENVAFWAWQRAREEAS